MSVITCSAKIPLIMRLTMFIHDTHCTELQWEITKKNEASFHSIPADADKVSPATKYTF